MDPVERVSILLVTCLLVVEIGHATRNCASRKIQETQACMDLAYPKNTRVISSVPGGGDMTFLETFCREKHYQRVTDCITKNLTSCEGTVDVPLPDTSLIHSMWTDICQNVRVITKHSSCYQSTVSRHGFAQCARERTHSIRRQLKDRTNPLTMQDRLDITCGVTFEAVSCDHQVIHKTCGAKAAEAIQAYANFTNLWACKHHVYQHHSSAPETVTNPHEMVHQPHAALFGLISGSYMLGCVRESLGNLDTCLAEVGIHGTHTHSELLLASGHKDFVDKLCIHRAHVSKCLTEAEKACHSLRKLYSIYTIVKALGSFCMNQTDYVHYSRVCYKDARKDLYECRRKVVAEYENSGDICRDNRQLNRCILDTVSSKCSTRASELLVDIHSARLPRQCRAKATRSPPPALDLLETAYSQIDESNTGVPLFSHTLFLWAIVLLTMVKLRLQCR